jgi:dCTP deaminase
MILTGSQIWQCVREGSIQIEPFNENQLSPNSYDVRLGDQVIVYSHPYLDTKCNNPYEIISVPLAGFVLERGHYYVGHIAEVVGSDSFVPMLHAKLGIAKLGLFVHVTANLIDIGNHCNFSLHLAPKRDIRVFPGMRIAQVSFWCVQGNINLYQGKYKGARGPAASQSYKHFVDRTKE